MTKEQMKALRGTYKIKCVRPGGLTLFEYGQYTFTEGEEIDLLDENLPATLRAGAYSTASNMCSNPGLELATLITVGDFVVTETIQPDLNVLR